MKRLKSARGGVRPPVMRKARVNEPWQLQTAKNKLTSLIERAQEAPQIITVHGKPKAIVLSPQQFERLSNPDELLSDFFGRFSVDDVHLAKMPGRKGPTRRELNLGE